MRRRGVLGRGQRRAIGRRRELGRGQRRAIGLAPLASACLLLWACSASLDLDRARRVLRPERSPAAPELVEAGADLPAPEGLRATSGELRAVPLQWDPLLTPGVAGYAIERSVAPDGPFVRMGAVVGNALPAYLDDDADQDGATFFYRVRPFAPSGALGARASAVAPGTTAPAPAPPTGIRAYSHQPRAVPLAWEPSADPSVGGYVIERSPAEGGPFERLAELEGRHATVYVDRGLGDLRVFYYRVSAVNRKGGRGRGSDPVRAVTKPDPLPPAGLRLDGQRLGANRLAWEPNVEADVIAYRFYRLRDGNRELLAELPETETSAVDPGVGADEPAAYSLIAVDRDGLDSEPAVPLRVRSVGYSLAASARPDGVHLAWNPRRDEGFQSARVFRHGALRTLELGVSGDGTWVDRAVEPGARYRYSVVLERADGTRGPPSSAVEIDVPRGKTPVR
jgi:fibronectin type 3 domain-containing protein